MAALYKYIQKNFQKKYAEKNPSYRKSIVKWRSEPTIIQVRKPTNLASARRIGYKAKQEIAVVRVRIRKGRRMRHKPMGGRKPSKSGRYFSRALSLQEIAEARAQRKVKDSHILGSYWVGEDGGSKFFEVVLCKCGCNCKC